MSTREEKAPKFGGGFKQDTSNVVGGNATPKKVKDRPSPKQLSGRGK